MYNFPAVVTLRDHIARGPRLRSDTLRAEVCEVVYHLKAAGWPPERVIVAVKRIADDAGLRPSPGVLAAYRPLSEGDAILVQIVQWVIDDYFGDAERAAGVTQASSRSESGPMLAHDSANGGVQHRDEWRVISE